MATSAPRSLRLLIPQVRPVRQFSLCLLPRLLAGLQQPVLNPSFPTVAGRQIEADVRPVTVAAPEGVVSQRRAAAVCCAAVALQHDLVHDAPMAALLACHADAVGVKIEGKHGVVDDLDHVRSSLENRP